MPGLGGPRGGCCIRGGNGPCPGPGPGPGPGPCPGPGRPGCGGGGPGFLGGAPRGLAEGENHTHTGQVGNCTMEFTHLIQVTVRLEIATWNSHVGQECACCDSLRCFDSLSHGDHGNCAPIKVLHSFIHVRNRTREIKSHIMEYTYMSSYKLDQRFFTYRSR